MPMSCCAIWRLLTETSVTMEKPTVFLKALETYRDSAFDFVDALLFFAPAALKLSQVRAR